MNRIRCEEDVDRWLVSPACRELLAFLKRIGEAMKGRRAGASIEIHDAKEMKVIDRLNCFLKAVEAILQEVEPLPMGNQRYGNKAFRIFIERIKEIAVKEAFLKELLVRSFGNETRIDYGTGHELFFVIACMVAVNADGINEMSQDLAAYSGINIFCGRYLKLVRQIQEKYSLEPAGSHGVWGLDDYQFVPFLLGAAQLVGCDDEISTEKAIEPSVFLKHEREFFYLEALAHVHRLKTRANPTLSFAHHSPLLHSISGVATWEKVYEGLGRMYCKEVLGKFPVVQHLLFDDKYFSFE